MHLRFVFYSYTTMLALIAGCQDAVLPPLVASGKYIDYHTDADASVVCMDEFLAREDRYVEKIADLLGVEAQAGIQFVWDPHEEAKESWACKNSVDCYRYDEDKGSGLIISRNFFNHHELVHAVEVPALGETGSRVLGEGLAEYLGSNKSTAGVAADFPVAFEKMLAGGPDAFDYILSLHFVGSLFPRYGAEKYRALRSVLPGDASPEQFADAFESIYGHSLGEALAEMVEPVHGLDTPMGCGQSPELEWSAPGLIDTTITSQCGDGTFFGTGYVYPRPAFTSTFAVQVSETGSYEFTIQGDGVEGVLRPCSFDTPSQSIASIGGRSITGIFHAGEHVLSLGFPQNEEPRGQAMVTLTLLSPSP